MMSFNPKKMPHLLSLAVAIITAVGMWYVVSVRDRLEAQLEVSIDYNGVPPNLVITDGLISKVHVRMRGPELLLRAITQQTLTQAINLSGIKKGTTVVPLSGEKQDSEDSCTARYRLSLAAANISLLLDAGVPAGNILHCRDCTSCDLRFGSFRRQTAAFPDSIPLEERIRKFTAMAAFVR